MGWLGDGLGWVWNHTVGAVAQGAAGFVWDQVVGGIVNWIVDAVAWFVGQVLTLLEDTTRVNLSSDWFSGSNSPYRTVLGVAAVLLLGFLFLGLIQGLLAGDPMAMLIRMARDLPLAVFGMVVTISVGDKLLQLSDELSHVVLHGGGDDAKQVLKVISTASSFSGQTSFVIALLGLLCIVAALFVWIELVVRSALIYLLVALSPLVFAAMVWPAARGMVRKLTELVLALIFSKVVIAVAFSVGAAALAGVDNTGHADAGATSGVSAGAGTLFSGLVIFGLAAFAPFVVLKLFPAAEAAIVAQGISRGPVRTTQQASASAFYLERLAGGHANGSNGAASRAAAQAGGDFGSRPPGGGSPNGGGAAPGPNGGASSGSGGGAAGGGAAGGGAAAAGPAAAALAAAEVGRRAGRAVRDRADRTTDAARREAVPRDPGGSSEGVDR
jgi:type IV secretion system protein TrbL